MTAAEGFAGERAFDELDGVGYGPAEAWLRDRCLRDIAFLSGLLLRLEPVDVCSESCSATIAGSLDDVSPREDFDGVSFDDSIVAARLPLGLPSLTKV